MPVIGENKVRFGRSYVYLNPETSVPSPEASRVGTWRLNRDEPDEPGPGPIPEGGLAYQANVLEDGGIVEGQLVYQETDGVKLAKADDFSTGVVAGVAISSGAKGDVISVTRNENVDIFNVNSLVDGGGVGGYLDIGAQYFLSATTAGNWTTTPDVTTAGAVVSQVGTAIGANKMSVEVQQTIVI